MPEKPTFSGPFAPSDIDLSRCVRCGLCLQHCPLKIKPRLDVFGDPPPSFDLMRRVKEQFDPKGILSPGRQVGRL